MDKAYDRLATDVYAIKADCDREAVQRIADHVASLPKGSLTSERLSWVLRELYWLVPETDTSTIIQGFGVEAKDFFACVKRSWASTSCEKCAADIPMIFEDRDDRDRVWGLTIFCAKCSTDRHRIEHERYESENRDRLAKEAAEHARTVESLRAIPYPEYLQTEHWQSVRDRAHEADGHACRVCGSTESLNVHHRTYERRGCELPGDVITLCKDCHQLFHDNGRLAKADG